MLNPTLRAVCGTIPIASPWADAALALPRILCSLLLAIDFGMSKFPTPQWFIDDVGKLGFPAPAFFAWAAVLSEVFASFLLALGLATRLNAALVCVTMLVAAFVQKWDASTWEKLPSLFFFLNAYLALIVGSGRFGLDRFIRKRLGEPSYARPS